MRFTPSAVLTTLFLTTSVFAQRMTTTLDVEVRQSAIVNLCIEALIVLTGWQHSCNLQDYQCIRRHRHIDFEYRLW